MISHLIPGAPGGYLNFPRASISLCCIRWCWKAYGTDQTSKSSISEHGSFNHTTVFQLFNKVALSGNCCQLHWIRAITWRATSAGKKALLIGKLKRALLTAANKKNQHFWLLIYRCLYNKLTWINPLWLIKGCDKPSQSWGHQVPQPASAHTNRKSVSPPPSCQWPESRSVATWWTEHWSSPYCFRTRFAVLWHLRKALQRQQLNR